MKETRNITFRKAALGSEIFEQICEFLGKQERSTLRIRNLEGPELESLSEFCSVLGLDISDSPIGGRQDGVRVGVTVTYSEAEFGAAKYLELARGEAIAYSRSTQDGTLKRDDYFQKSAEVGIGPVGNGRFGVMESVMQELQASSLTGVEFEEMKVEDGWKAQEEKIFELVTPIVLPPMASSGVNNRGEICSAEDVLLSDDGFYVLDGLVSDSRISFDFNQLPDFDFAKTQERFGPLASQAVPRFICSNEFYRIAVNLCSTLEWKMVLPAGECLTNAE